MSTAESNPPPLPDGWGITSSICKLPLELMLYIIALSLPGTGSSTGRMKALYSTRMVSRIWRDAIDSTPSLWNIVSSSVPLHVNSTAIQRSGSYPLDVYITRHRYKYGRTHNKIDYAELLELAAKEIRRWSIACLWLPSPDVCSQYLTSSAPLLRDLALSWGVWSDISTPVTLFSGRLEDLEVDGAPIDWTSSFIHGLKNLDITNVMEEQLSTQRVLDILASSPLLERLGIYHSTLDHPLRPFKDHPALIKLSSLKTIQLQMVNTEATGIILSSIRAPNCLSLTVLDECRDEIGVSSFPEPALSHFNDFQRHTLSSNDVSILHFFDESMDWESGSTSLSRLAFELDIPYNAPAVGVGWVTHVVGLGTQELVHNMEVGLSHERLSDDDLAAYYAFSRCQSVTTLQLYRDHLFSRPILELLGTWRESDDGTGRLPAFPGLEVLVLEASEGWSLDDLEVLVSRRFGERDDGTAQYIPNLSFVLEASPHPDYRPGSNPDLTQLQRLRAAKGVAQLTRTLEKPVVGMLAVVYEETTKL